MVKLAGLIFTPIYYLVFGLLLLLFQPIQAIALYSGGYQRHKKSVGLLNYLLVKSLYILGSRLKFEGTEKLPRDRPLIVVANHQSFFDIQSLVLAFNPWHPKFVSKIELSRNIPSISFNLRHGGSALINRKNGVQSIREIIRLGKLIEANNYAACIFPEGTRSREGQVRAFREAGIKSLLKTAPSALVVPFVIDGHDKLMKHGYFPLQFGVKISYTALDPIEPSGIDAEEIIARCEQLIKKKLGQ